jgi:hypothetical protein
VVGLLGVGITATTTAQAGNQLFEGSWTVKAFGNELTSGTGPSEFYSATGIPLGFQCNKANPRCPFNSTPVTTTTMKGGVFFNPLGGGTTTENGSGAGTRCSPWSDWQGKGTTMRPAKGGTPLTTMGNQPYPPLYRNYAFFTTATANAQPDPGICSGKSTGYTTQNKTRFGKNKGKVMVGHPITGAWSAATTGTQLGGFSFAAAPATGAAGVRTTGQVGDIPNLYPYLYSYTYATLRNNAGVFGVGGGPGSFSISYTMGDIRSVMGEPVVDGEGDAQIIVKAGAARFGGTMRMLGALTTKVCYFRNGGCSLGGADWRYDAIGASGYFDNTTGSYGLPTANAVISQGYLATYKA